MKKTDPAWRKLRPLLAKGASYWKGEAGPLLFKAQTALMGPLFSPLQNTKSHWTKMQSQIVERKVTFDAAAKLIVARLERIEPGLPLREWVEGFVAAAIQMEAWVCQEMARELHVKSETLLDDIPNRLRGLGLSGSRLPVKMYALTDGEDVIATKLMTNDEHAAASRTAREATDGAWYWGEAD